LPTITSIVGGTARFAYQPLAIEFEVPPIEADARLFIGDLQLAPGDHFPEEVAQPMGGGRVAVVVEAGEVDIVFDDGTSLTVPSEQWTAIDAGQPFQLVNNGSELAEGYVAGVVAADGEGWINQQVITGDCPL
jgi:hypothetical protein